jgi:hypothetical protein
VSGNPSPARIYETTLAGLNAVRRKIARMRAIADECDRLGEPVLGRDARRIADDLSRATCRVELVCLLHDGTFAVDYPAEGPPVAIEAVVCGPCNARTTADVLAARSAENRERGVHDGERKEPDQ